MEKQGNVGDTDIDFLNLTRLKYSLNASQSKTNSDLLSMNFYFRTSYQFNLISHYKLILLLNYKYIITFLFL